MLAEAAAHGRRRRAGTSSAACTFPLLMPTTLFVLVNAVINAFRIVDHIIVMTRGGPDNATTLLLFHIYQVGFSFWDTAYAAALSTVLLSCSASSRCAVLPARAQDPLSMRSAHARYQVD